MTASEAIGGRAQARGAGIVTAVVGFAGTSAVVLTGLAAVGASPSQAASGLLALCVTQGLGTVLLAQRTRRPITLAWSTPGAALLIGSGAVEGGWAAAVGAFLVCGVLVLATALWPLLGRLVRLIPASVAAAMLAGVLLPLCVASVTAAVRTPLVVLPAVVAWLAAVRLAPRWAAPTALAAALVVVGIALAVAGPAPGTSLELADLVPRVELTAPAFTLAAAVALGIPLFVVTMASQNLPGVAVLASFGYETPWRAAMTTTAAATLVSAPFGGHVVNLAAISAALSASPSAHPDPAERWRAARTAGWTNLVLGLASAALAAVIVAGPAGVVAAAAGLALVPSLAASLASAVRDPGGHLPAVATFVVAASGITVGGLGAAFCALVVGVLVHLALRTRATPRDRLDRHEERDAA
ncbi:benzoate/H(+) symporter BenE family transporter [Clavibacter capsici]|uniref:Benzoate transporter n=1 Tax=Clavibacter capsici TaxID=1874630 RepID=A0AAE6XPF9_9MICO|nr:benzoate/H(+) symporter BenE family transporter [Clavibacter capsici]ALD11984.1 benzoate transporter [Clavibacter capsici]QIS44075.1 benzoate transporter [Clavibacter capsici]